MDAFIDESWATTKSSDDLFLVVVSVMTTDRRKLELTVRKLRRIPNLKIRAELKAWSLPPQITKKVLLALADDPNISIVAAIWQGKRSKVKDHEELYQKLVGHCALHTVKRHKRIDLFLDKRYTSQKRQQQLEEAIREAIASVPGNIVRVFQVDSQKTVEITAPDFVAWAFMQRYCRANAEFYNIIRGKVAHFDNLSK